MRKLLVLLLLSPCALLAQVPDYVPTDGLVAYWPLDGHILDATGNHDGTNSGAVAIQDQSGIADQAMALPAGNDFFDLPGGLATDATDITLSFWAWLSVPSSGAAVLLDRPSVTDNIWSLDYQTSTGTIHFVTRNDDGSGYQNMGNWAMPSEQWTHITTVFRKDSDSKEIYANGELVDSASALFDGFTLPPLRFGEAPEGNNADCRFSDIGLWTRALSPAEIAGLHAEQPASTLPDYVPTDGLVAWYPLDSTALDESGNGHHLALDGPTWGAGTEDAGDQALLFDGQDDVALIPHHPDFNSPEMSLSFWVNVHTDQLLDSPGLSDFMGMINKTDLDAPVLDRRQFDVQLYAESAGTSPFNLGWLASTGHSVNESDMELVTAPANLPAFEWNHIVVTASDSTLSIHVNGEHIATNGLLHPRVLNTADIQIGRDYLGLAQRHFNGRMDDIAFYNRVLTDEEIEALFDSTTEPEEEENQALDFPGIDVPYSESGVMEVPYDAALDRTGTDPFTIAADVLLEDEDWFNLFHTGQDGDPENNITFRLSPSEINLFWENAGVNYQLNSTLASQQLGPLATGQWHHIAASWDGSTLALYVNGLLIATDSPGNGGPGETADRSFYWGSKHGEHSLHGQLDNAQFWTVGLSQSDIIGYMGCPPVGNEPGLEGYWTFDGPDSEVALDITGNGHDGSTLGLSRVTSTRPACSTGSADLFGCTDSTACNYDDGTLFSDGSCVYGCQFCGENTVWDSLLLQCVSPLPSIDTVFISLEVPIPSCGTGTVWDPVAQACIVAIPTDTDFDGCVSAGDVLNLLATFGTCPPIPFSGPCQGLDHVTYLGHDYDIVAIGDQCWFAENLQSEAYQNGDPIPGELNGTEWQTAQGAQSIYEELSLSEVLTGRLYNLHAVIDPRNLCPAGWHVPSLAEFNALLDTAEVAELKSTSGWADEENSGSSGFNALPGGRRDFWGNWYDAGNLGVWWTSTPEADGHASWRLEAGQSSASSQPNTLQNGFSVRCLKN